MTNNSKELIPIQFHVCHHLISSAGKFGLRFSCSLDREIMLTGDDGFSTNLYPIAIDCDIARKNPLELCLVFAINRPRLSLDADMSSNLAAGTTSPIKVS